MSQITVLDYNGDQQTIAAVDDTGQALEADSLPVVLPAAQVALMATEATLADILTAANAIAADPATATLQASIVTALDALSSLLASLDAKTAAVDTGSVAGTVGLDAPTLAALEAITAATGGLTNAELRAAPVPVVDAVPAVTNLTLTTSAAGATFVPFASQSCSVLRIVNAWPGAVDIEVRRGGAGVTIPVPGGAERAFDGLTNANELEVRRIDQSNTQVTISCEKVVL